MIGIHDESTPGLSDLWSRTLTVVTHERSTVTAPILLKRLLIQERARLSRKFGAGWLERIEREYYRPSRKASAPSTHGPPPTPDSFID